ncbi:MAG: carboxypeptidase regulatory-like domain-containing protein, partial [Verrucomicrobiales bacterium]
MFSVNLRSMLGILLIMVGSSPAMIAHAQVPLATLRYQIVGIQLKPTPAMVTVPKGVPGSIAVQLVNGDGTPVAYDPMLSSNAIVEATLRGPSFQARRIIGQLGEPLMLPPLNLSGDYQLDGIKLVDAATGETRLEATPSSVPVRIFDEVLISKVTSRPLSMQEITDKGIVIDESNYRAVEFEVGFVLDGKTIPIKFPVIAPSYKDPTEIIPAAEMHRRLLEAQLINNQLAEQAIGLESIIPELQRPGLNIQVRGVNFQPAADEGPEKLQLGIPPIPALMVIPGNIGYLNQFFSVQIFTENGSPDGSGLTVYDVVAKLKLPNGPDGVPGVSHQNPGDDPLRFARVGPDAEIHSTLPIVGVAPNRLSRFGPSQGGTAEFLVEGLQEGLHTLDLDLTAQLEGLAAGAIKIQGKAAGSVLVRNPKFSMTFSHPRTVRAGEPYNAYVTILNTSNVEANQVSVNLRGASLSGGVLESPEVAPLGNIAPGQSATATFRVRSQRTGQIKFSNLTTGENSVLGRFNLTMGIDERGVELSPDSIGYPDYVNFIPPAVMDAANRVLGQALSVATAPLLPNGIKPVARSIITRRVLDLAEAGQRLKLSDGTNRVAMDLLLDWAGGRTGEAGFDQIIRETDAGREFRQAMALWQESADALDGANRLSARNADIAGRSEQWILAGSSHSLIDVGAIGATGESTSTKSMLPYTFSTQGTRGGMMISRGSGVVPQWKATENVGSAVFTVSIIQTNGIGTHWTWNVANVPNGSVYRFDPLNPGDGLMRDDNGDGVAEAYLAGTMAAIHELPPSVLAVVQDIDVSVSRPWSRCSPGAANSYGQVLLTLFSKPMQQELINVPVAYKLDNGTTANGVQVQPGGRVALLSLNEGISAIRPRKITVAGVKDQRGASSVEQPIQVKSELKDGAAITGRVLRADGSVAVGVPVTVTMYDPHKDPFDRCDPIIVSRVAQKYTDSEGYFSFDFVHGGVGFTIAAVDTGGLTVEAIDHILKTFSGNRFAADKLAAQAAIAHMQSSLGVGSVQEAINLVEGLDRAVWSDNIDFHGGRMGRELTVALRFRGRGVVAGTVVGPDGQTPVAGAAVNLTPDPDSRELAVGQLTDANGRFTFHGVPLGNFGLRVESSLRHFRTVAGRLSRVRETNNMTIVLTAPTAEEIVRSTLKGRVVEPDGLTGHESASVFLTWMSDNKAATVASIVTDAAGYWEAADLPVGTYNVRVISRDGRRSGNGRAILSPGIIGYSTVALNGVGTVSGRVETSSGQPVAHAKVAGGIEVVTTGPDGTFTLTGVPLGTQVIHAGLEAQHAPGGFARVSSASVIVLPEVENTVVIRLPKKGRIIGQVFDAQGKPWGGEGKNVAIPVEGDFGGFFWAKTDSRGQFEFPNMNPGEYLISAPAPPVEEEEDVEEILSNAQGSGEEEVLAAVQGAADIISKLVTRRYGETTAPNPGAFGYTKSAIRFDGDTAVVEIHFLPQGNVDGTVINDQGVPIGAAVRLTGMALNGRGTPTMRVLGDRTSDPATGLFSFFGLTQGPWSLQAASPFYPVVISTNSATSLEALNVTNVFLKFPPISEVNGRLVGNVVYPDGTPVGSNVNVQISFGPDFIIRTDVNGNFDAQIKIPAGSYSVEAKDPQSGLRGITTAQVTAGLTNQVTVQLLGKGDLNVTILMANGLPAVDAAVRVAKGGYPAEVFEGRTGSNGELNLRNLFQGSYSVSTIFNQGASRLEGRVNVNVEVNKAASALIRLGPTGTIRGVFRTLAEKSPIAGARVDIGNVAKLATDIEGRFEASGFGLGTHRIIARDPVDGRVGIGTATIAANGQVVDVIITQMPEGTLAGTVFQQGEESPVEGATVMLTRTDALYPMRTVTTGPDGYYEFPGLIPGAFTVQARHDKYSRHISEVFPDNGGIITLDLTLPPKPRFGSITVTLLDADGVKPATNATVNTFSTDLNGTVVLAPLELRQHEIIASSKIPGRSSSHAFTNVVLSDFTTNASVTLRLSPVASLSGKVVGSDGVTGVQGAQVFVTCLLSIPTATGRTFTYSQEASTISGAGGVFTFNDMPPGSFRVRAISGALAGSESGAIPESGELSNVVVKLGASGSVIGRVLRADGTNVVGNLDVSLKYKAPSGLDGLAVTKTDANGEFRFDVVPVGPVDFSAVMAEVNGLSMVKANLQENGDTLDLGDILLDEDWPEVVLVEPAPDAEGVSVVDPIRLTFSEPILTNSIHTNGIYLRSLTKFIPTTLSWETPTNGAVRRLLMTPIAPLESMAVHRVVVLDGVRLDGLGGIAGIGPNDAVERPLQTPFASTFVTRDSLPPVLLSIFPTNNSVQIDPRAVIRLSFNEAIRNEGISISLVGPNGSISGQVDVGLNSQVVTFTPAQPLPINATLNFTVSGIQDLAGNMAQNQPFVSTFRTLDTIGPAVSELRIADSKPPIAGSARFLEAIVPADEGTAVRFSANFNLLGAVDASPYRMPITLPLSGSVTYRATATDLFGNDGPFAELTVTVISNLPPAVKLVRLAPA